VKDSKFRYLIFPDNIYTIELDSNGANPVKLEMSGEELINKIKKQMLLDIPSEYEL
jgi:hypothetical protein